MSLQVKERPTHSFIDLDALAFNFHSSKRFIGTDIKYMAVVKANAYGHGAAQCALRLETEGVDWFGVALPEEGVELRRAGVALPILCLGSFWPGQEKMIIDYALTPVIYDPDTAECLDVYTSGRGLTIDIHVKVDTGMGRVGVRYEDVADFANGLKKVRNLNVAGLLTHFASADDPNETEFTNVQIERFNTACNIFRAAGHDPKWIDAANSPGAIRYPSSRGNMVRLGGALYGLLDDILRPETVRPELKPVLSLRSRIAHIKRVPRGESLGYGRTFVTTRDSIIALVPIGYADGYPRSLSNRGKASVSGSIAPLVGRVSMDWTLFDVTDVPGVAIGDQVVLIGDEITAADLARECGTIAYEVTCGISPRVPKIYE